MSRQFWHDLEFIYWAKESDFILLTNQEYAEKLAFYKEHGTLIEDKTRRYSWISVHLPYRTDQKGKWHQMYTYEPERKKKGLKAYVRYSTNELAATRVENPGRIAYNTIIDKLREQTGLNREIMKKCFGHGEEELKRCVPKQFYLINERFTGHMVAGVSGIDFCAHFPTNIMGRLPDANTEITYEGIVEPTEEYPFAFYVNSGHSAELGRYDTRKWLKSVFAFRLFSHKEDWDWDLSVKPEEEKTILMKASDVNMDDVMRYFYDRRKTDPVAKLVMNAFIGYLHKKGEKYSKNPYAHLAAVCLCRANQSMLEMAEKIGIQNIIQICVDGCIYRGFDEYGVHEHGLGLVEQEFTGCVIWIESTNKYLVKDKNGEKIKLKIQGCNYYRGEPITEEILDSIDFRDLKYLERRNILT